MSSSFNCWQCGHGLAVMMPFSRREVCDTCNADQHSCRMCQHYDASISDQCREDRAERVSDKERANFCDYFSPNPQAYQGGDNNKKKVDEAKAKLEALFGGSTVEENKSKENPNESNTATSPQDKNAAAKKALDDLFKPPNSKS